MTTNTAIASSTALAATASLTHLSALDIKGNDAAGFLQGQTSAQVNLANGQFAPLTCFCTPKGRMLANGQLLRVTEDHYRLIMHASLVAPLMAHLKKFAPFYKVELAAADAILLGANQTDARMLAEHFGLALPTAAWQQASAGQASMICYPEESGSDNDSWRWLLMLTAADAEALNCQGDTTRWQLADVRRGLVWLDADQQDSYLPQMLNWEALGGISFKKGCYTGQEVVARAHFRGQVKKRLQLGYLNVDTAPASAAGVTTDEDKNIGAVIASAPAANGQTAILAVLNTRPLEKNPTLDIEDTTLTLAELPYAIERVDPETLATEAGA